MHENPRATDEEQELAQTKRLSEEEGMRGGHTSSAEELGVEEEDSDADGHRDQ
jgi:hypothetical protein